jgi:AcrR family transcriptional regulator
MEQNLNPLFEQPKIDRRIVRTKKALHDALMELLKEKGYEAVTVEEITQRANVARATFYLHYQDKEDLLISEFIDVANERVQALSHIPFSVWVQNPNSLIEDGIDRADLPLMQVFVYVAEHADLIRILLQSDSAQRIAYKVSEIITHTTNEFIQSKLPGRDVPFRPGVPIDLLAAYFSGALLSSIYWWVENNLTPSPEQMARNFQQLFFPGASLLLPLGE